MSAEADLHAENTMLRERVLAAERSTAQTLARATRLSQVVSVLGSDNAIEAVVAHAAREVAELFSADIGLLMLGAPDALCVRGTWGVRETDLPAGRFGVAGLERLGVDAPVATGPAATLPQPEWLARYRPRHLAWVRLLVGAESLGVLLLVRRADQPFERVDRHELSAIGYRIALALENGLLHDQMRGQLLQLGRMHELTTRLNGAIEVETVAELIARAIVDDVPALACRVQGLREGDAGTLASAGDPCDDADWLRFPLQNGDRLVGSVDVAGGPADETDGLEFLRHVVSVAALALDKALLYERNRDQARHDSLTGLLGHRVFQEEMQRHLGAPGPFAIVRLDIDDFKRVNDLCGHQVGDDALRLVAHALRGAVRDGDQVFRVGGEEFCAILPGLAADGATAFRIAERLRQCVADIELPLPVTVSLGLAGSPLHARERDALLEQADIALYASKHTGKNRTTLAGAPGG